MRFLVEATSWKWVTPEIGEEPTPNHHSYDKFQRGKSCLDSWLYQVYYNTKPFVTQNPKSKILNPKS